MKKKKTKETTFKKNLTKPAEEKEKDLNIQTYK